MRSKKGKKLEEKEEQQKTKQYKIQKGKKTKKKHKVLRKVILGILLIILLVILIAVGIVAGIFFSSKYKVTKKELEINNFNSQVVDSDGNVIATLNGDENRKWTSIEDMPEYLPKMFVALEDERFYEHSGIDIKRTLGATAQFIFRRGSSSYGGSTITQQLIKNTYKDDDNSGIAGVERKIREMSRAYNTEKVLTKGEILELYLNKIFMGGTYYGVGTAAEYYFSKDVKDLSLAEAAYLVAINTSPNAYEPFSTDQEEIDRIKNKVKVVLAKFKEEAPNLEYKLTDEEYNAAVAEVESGLPFKRGAIATKASSYTYHTAAAIKQAVQQLEDKLEITEQEAKTRVYNNGYTIYSTQVTSIQNEMQEEFAKDKYIVKGREKKKDGTLLNDGHTQSAMVIIDPKTGNVVGCMGGLGTDSDSTGYNRAIQGTKHPGSSIKPIGVIAPSLEKQIITASTVYADLPTTFGGNYSPKNSESTHYYGLLTVRHAIETSSNIINVKIMAELGAKNSAEFLRKMNFDKISDDDIGLSLALGATSVTPLQMAAAYAMIANEGVYIEPSFFTKIVDTDGEIVLEAKQEKTRMMSVQNAYILEKILTAPVTGSHGTAGNCSIRGMEVGAKTGSTEGYKDRWLCGITPYYAAACWFGFDNAEYPTGLSGNNASKIWSAVMNKIHSDLPSANFEKPSGIVTARICKDSGCVAVDSCTSTETEYFVSGTVPRQCEGHTTLKICKETGKIANEYCKNTEERTYLEKPSKENTQLWSTNYGSLFTKIPTETCDTHKAPETVDMINVVDKTLSDAKKQLEDLGLKVETKNGENTKKKDGIVLSQSVLAGTKVEKGSTITLTINKIENKTNTTKENTTRNKTTVIVNETTSESKTTSTIGITNN